jgi:ABC-type transporter Mla maintaining outer membrane lipid asymmetry ATPase subunit MlaF
VRENGRVAFHKARDRKAGEADFIMLKDGRIAFEGTASELRTIAARDPYIHSFLS